MRMKVASSMLVIALCTSFALAQPNVSGTLPPELRASESRQWITVVGSGLTPASTVTLSWGERVFPIPADRAEFVSPQSIRIFAGIFPADQTWTVTVTNPDGAASPPVGFVFVASAEPAQPVPDDPAHTDQDAVSVDTTLPQLEVLTDPQLQAAIDRAPERLAQLMGAVQGVHWSWRMDDWLCLMFADAWWHESDRRVRPTIALVSHALDRDDEVSRVRDAIDTAARRLNYIPTGWVRNFFDPIHFGTVEDPSTRFDLPRVRFEFVLFQRPAGMVGIHGCAFALLVE